MNCVGLIECGLLLGSRVDVSPVCALSRVVCAVLSSVAHAEMYFCIFIVDIDMHIVYDMYMNLYSVHCLYMNL